MPRRGRGWWQARRARMPSGPTGRIFLTFPQATGTIIHPADWATARLGGEPRLQPHRPRRWATVTVA